MGRRSWFPSRNHPAWRAAVFLKACSLAGLMEACLHNSCESRPALPSRISEDGADACTQHLCRVWNNFWLLRTALHTILGQPEALLLF